MGPPTLASKGFSSAEELRELRREKARARDNARYAKAKADASQGQVKKTQALEKKKVKQTNKHLSPKCPIIKRRGKVVRAALPLSQSPASKAREAQRIRTAKFRERKKDAMPATRATAPKTAPRTAAVTGTYRTVEFSEFNIDELKYPGPRTGWM